MLRALAELDFPLVITTNYDQLLENALAAAGKQPRVAVYTPNLEATTDYRDPTAAESRSSSRSTATSRAPRRSLSQTRTTSSSSCG